MTFAQSAANVIIKIGRGNAEDVGHHLPDMTKLQVRRALLEATKQKLLDIEDKEHTPRQANGGAPLNVYVPHVKETKRFYRDVWSLATDGLEIRQ